MVRILGWRRNHEAGSPPVLGTTPIIPRRLRHFGAGLRELFKRNRLAIYEPDRQKLAEILTGVQGASPIWCGGCRELMVPIVSSDGDDTKLVAVACLNPCCVSLPVQAGLLMGGEPAAPML